jgi:hypothetical protein
VLELVATNACVVGAYASAAALDSLAPAGALRVRVAPDEVMLVREPGAAAILLRDTDAVTAGDADAVVIDATDGWAVWTLEGVDAREAFSRLSDVRPPERGSIAGDVAHVPVHVIAEPGRLHLFVPSMWRGYLRRRILERCASFDIKERATSQAWGSAEGSA